MKKLFALLVVAGMVAIVACGPSAEEKRAQEIADSLKADSIAKVQADSIAKLADTVKADSTATASSTEATK